MGCHSLPLQEGQVHGGLTVLAYSGKDDRGNYVWRCYCAKCKQEVSVTAARIGRNSISCGCVNPNGAARKNRIGDLTGMRFGYVTVVRKLETVGPFNSTQWECKCTCGELVTKRTGHLRQRGARSCGCMRRGRHRPLVAQTKRYGWVSSLSPARMALGTVLKQLPQRDMRSRYHL